MIRRADALTERHFGRTVRIAGGHPGTLVGTLPLGDRVQLALIVGGQHVWTEALPGDAEIEIEIERKTP